MDKILGQSRKAFGALKGVLAKEQQHVMSALDALLQPGTDLGSLLGLSSAELAAMSDADRLALLLASPVLRAELQLVHGIDSEPDTDADDGMEATDLDDSDLE